MAAVLRCLCDGAVFGTFIDWRGYPTVHSAAVKLGLKPLNLIVWSKTNAGMGSLYRSQHELLPVFKNGSAPHVNNVELGKRGRWRSNVWTYPGASSLGSDARRGLEDHPTVKPTAMVEDALLDLTDRGDIVIDPFLGSGSTRCGQEERPGLPRGRIRSVICPRDRPSLRGCNGLALVVRLTGCKRTSDIRPHAAVQKATNYRTGNGRCQSDQKAVEGATVALRQYRAFDAELRTVVGYSRSDERK